jgi:hypothetical protein
MRVAKETALASIGAIFGLSAVWALMNHEVSLSVAALAIAVACFAEAELAERQGA